MSSILQDYFRELSTIIAAQRTDPYAALEMTSLMSSMVPMTFLTMALSVLSWGLLALGVVAASLDYKELGRLGYPRRFHWAWSFLTPVYPIGRAVVVHRQTGAGLATMWISIVATATTFVLSTAWSIWLTFAFFQQFIALRGTIA